MNQEDVIVEISLGLTKKDRFLIISDKYSKEFYEKIYKKGKSITETKLIIIEDFGKRPLTYYPEKMKKIIEDFKPTASAFIAKTLEGEIKFRIPLLRHLVEELKVRHVHMPGVDRKIWETGLEVDYRKVEEITLKVFEFVKNAREIRVETKLGTDVVAEEFYRWVPDTGILREQGKFCNLPAGEVFTAPKKVDGKLVVDGCLGDYFVKYGKLKNPIIVKIENSYVVDIQGKNEKLIKELEKYIFEGPENSDRIGEFAIGTNVFLKEIIGNLLQDEKFPGVHLAVGDPYPEETGAPWSSEVHLDMVVTKTDVIVDGKKIMERGKFIF